ncbi:MAG: nucleotide exchange factor GrpE [Planctomycetes bacterium]|nr:nucleotide exchange factor GrpE [Planctomycetota bacterium]
MDEKAKKTNEEEELKSNESAKALDKEMDKLQQDFEALRKEKDELVDRLQRVYADYANFQKRVPKNIADTVAYEKERFIRSFLPILDNFDRTLREAQSAQNVEAVARGVEIIRDQMLTILKTHGVHPIDALNEKFDPARHEAMLRRSEPDKEDDVVLEEFQRGYALNGKVLRPSRVAINKIQAPARTAQAPGAQSPQSTPQTEEQVPAEGTEATETASE